MRGDPLRYAAASAVCLTPVSLSRGLKGSFGFLDRKNTIPAVSGIVLEF